MRRLSALDAQFLNIEDRTNFGHVGALVLLDPPASDGRLTLDAIRAVLEPRLHLAAPFRRRLLEVPLRVGYPYWVDDPDFDVEFHLREVGLPGPGTAEQLAEQVARIHSRPLDRSRPLWEMYLIHGLADGRYGLYTKIHHAAIDGITGAEILAAIMDVTPQPREVPAPQWRPEPVPSRWQQLPAAVASVASRSADLVTGLPRSLPHLASLPGARLVPGLQTVAEVADVVRGLAGIGPAAPAPRSVLVAPRTPFNGPITAHRRFAYVRVPLDRVKRVKAAYGLTVNDVVLTLTAGALRSWLLDHDALVEVPLVAAVPVSVRVADGDGSTGAGPPTAVAEDTDGANQVSVMLVALPTHLADPAARLEFVAAEVQRAKAEFDALPATILQDLAVMLPTALSGLAARSLFRLVTRPGPPFNLFVSNVPGPQLPLYVAGARVRGIHPASAVTDITGGLNITLFSYDGGLDVGLVACREMVPDLWRLAGYLEAALDELSATA